MTDKITQDNLDTFRDRLVLDMPLDRLLSTRKTSIPKGARNAVEWAVLLLRMIVRTMYYDVVLSHKHSSHQD